MTMRDEDLIGALRRAGADSTAIPVSDPQFVAAVTDQVRAMPPPGALRRRTTRRRAGAGMAAAVAAVLIAVPGPREAFARWLGIGSVRISTGSTRGGLPAAIRDLDLGLPSSQRRAEALVGHPLWTSRGREPLGIWIDPPRRGAHTVYRVGDNEVLLSELPGPGEIYLVKKMAAAGTEMEFLTLRDQPAIWLSGHPHEVLMAGPEGVENVPVRLAGNVLLWADGTRTIRIEGFEDRDDAVAFFDSLGT